MSFSFENIESSQKNGNFGLKPGKWLILNCPDLKVGAIDVRDIQGFSHINEIYWHFLDQAQYCKGIFYYRPGNLRIGGKHPVRLI